MHIFTHGGTGIAGILIIEEAPAATHIMVVFVLRPQKLPRTSPLTTSRRRALLANSANLALTHLNTSLHEIGKLSQSFDGILWNGNAYVLTTVAIPWKLVITQLWPHLVVKTMIL
jgi:hypothetical protein